MILNGDWVLDAAALASSILQCQVFGCIGEPLVFIEVALTNNTENSIQKVLFDEAICEENQATTALLYSISSTQGSQVWQALT
jgi:hypothetical protein